MNFKILNSFRVFIRINSQLSSLITDRYSSPDHPDWLPRPCLRSLDHNRGTSALTFPSQLLPSPNAHDRSRFEAPQGPAENHVAVVVAVVAAVVVGEAVDAVVGVGWLEVKGDIPKDLVKAVLAAAAGSPKREVDSVGCLACWA